MEDFNLIDFKVYKDYQKEFFKYEAALKTLELQLQILGEEFLLKNNYNPIEHIKSRIKTLDSTIEKLKRNGYEPTYQNMLEHINDIVGVRIVCSFKSDVYDLVNLIKMASNFTIFKEQDYIKNPKETGYSSYHINLLLPIYLTTGVEYVKAEIQIRTMAMDFWASIDHKLCYKHPKTMDEEAKELLVESAKEIRKLDEKMGQFDEKLNKN